MNPAMSIPFVTEMLRSIYNALFSWAARTPRSAFVVVCAFVVAGLASAPKLRQESLLPNFKETDLVVRWQGNSGASHPAMSRIAGLASRELRSVPGVLNVSAHVGRAVMSDKRTGINAGELWVSLDPTADYDETVASVKQVVASYPGLSPEVLTYLQAKVRKELSGTGDSLVVRVYGEDMNTLRKKAEDVNTILSRTAGIVESKVQYPTLMPTLEIEVDMDKANRYGLKPGDVRRATTTLVSGIEVGSLFEEQKVFDVMVYGTPGTRRSLTAVQELLIDTPSGGHVRLKDVADMRIVPAAAVINRDAVARRIDVTANVRGRDLGSVGDEIEDRLQEVEFPLEYRAELLGEYAERDAAEQRVLAFVIAAAIGIFLLLQAYFRSWRLATVIFLGLPMALSGGVLAVFMTSGGAVSLGSIIGFVAVLGIVVRNSITLVSRYRHLGRRDGESFGAELVQRATREQSAPILMTAVAIALVFLPLVFSGNIAGLEVAHPMAIVVLGGLVTATLFTLLGVPAMYVLFGPAREGEFKNLSGAAATEEEMREGMAKT